MGKDTARKTANAWPAFERPAKPHTFSAPAEGILLLDNFLSLKVRKSFLTLLTAPHSPVKLDPPTAPKRGEAARTNERVAFSDPDLADRLWNDTGLREACQQYVQGHRGRKPVGLNPNLRIYRYSPGAYFGRTPASCVRAPVMPSQSDPPPPPCRQLTTTMTMSSKDSASPSGPCSSI